MDDTLSTLRFDRKTVKTQLGAQERFALQEMLDARKRAGEKCTGWGLVRELVMEALERTEWPLERRISEYAEYQVECLRSGRHNEFESE